MRIRAPFTIEPYMAECLVWELFDAMGNTLALLAIRKMRGYVLEITAKWFR